MKPRLPRCILASCVAARPSGGCSHFSSWRNLWRPRYSDLLTRLTKYGALSVPDGRIQIQWSHDGVGSLVLRWIETNGPPVGSRKSPGFGSKVMETMIRNPLKGGLRFDWHPEGLACEISLPVMCTTGR